MGDARGSVQPGTTRILNSEGRLLAGIEYPATIARMAGRMQRNVLRRIERGNAHAWALVTAPLVCLPDGQLAVIWAHSERPHGFSEEQIEGLELIGRLLGASMARGWNGAGTGELNNCVSDVEVWTTGPWIGARPRWCPRIIRRVPRLLNRSDTGGVICLRDIRMSGASEGF
jgi:hypothetical protein